MAEHELWRGEQGERWRVMERMEEDRAARERHALRDTGGEGEYRRRLAEQRGGSAGPGDTNRGRGPRGYRRSDARILEDVSDRLTEDRDLDASGIEVEVADGEVTLKGTVSDRAARRRAEDIASSVSGVRHVTNDLRAAATG
jgi:osmotically-inducible protein OsmY